MIAILILLTLFAFSMPAQSVIPIDEQGKIVHSIAPMLKTVNPAIVNIATEAYVESNLMNDPFFRFFYGLPKKKEVSSLGSGVIVDAKNGYILTNNHVIQNADAITVSLQNRKKFAAKIIGTDQDTDLAVIQIEPDDLTQLEFADSKKLQVGDFVVAIGNPFGLGHSVTSGIVSALGRQGLGIEQYEDFIQTDAAINPGNSGGALVNLKGELVGINTAIVGPSGGNVGIGFAIPSDVAQNILAQLIKFGEVRRGLFGVYVDTLTNDIVRGLDLNVKQGVIVTGVEPRSSATKAGVETYDVITKLNGRPITTKQEFYNLLGLITLGSTVELELYRNNKRKILSSTLTEIPVEKLTGEKLHPFFENVTFAETIDSQRTQFGVRIDSIDRNSRAAYWGLRQGDIIVGVGRYRVKNIDDLKSLVARAGRVINLTIERNDRSYLVTIK